MLLLLTLMIIHLLSEDKRERMKHKNHGTGLRGCYVPSKVTNAAASSLSSAELWVDLIPREASVYSGTVSPVIPMSCLLFQGCPGIGICPDLQMSQLTAIRKDQYSDSRQPQSTGHLSGSHIGSNQSIKSVATKGDKGFLAQGNLLTWDLKLFSK